MDWLSHREDLIMVRVFWIFVVTVTAMTGCRNHCCYRKGCTACAPPGPIIGQSFAAPVPATTTPTPAPEVLMPSNAPPATTPPSTSGYVPAPTSNQPAVTLQAPEFSSAEPRANQASRTAGPVPSSIKPVVAGKLFTGNKPTLDDVDRLATAGVKQVAFVSETDKVVEADVFQSRGIEVTTIRAGENSMGELNVLRNRGPVFVYSDDGETLRSFWKKYYREVELLSDDAARVCADAITMK
jgi:hypothetical protein